MAIEILPELSYEYFWHRVNSYACQDRYDLAIEAMKFILKQWPEKVIARGELAEDLQVPDPKLKRSSSIPGVVR